jgi:hypothetical protein
VLTAAIPVVAAPPTVGAGAPQFALSTPEGKTVPPRNISLKQNVSRQA